MKREKEMTSINWGRNSTLLLSSGSFLRSIDGGLLPWIDTLLEALLRYSPLTSGHPVLPQPSIPPPRVKLIPADGVNGDSEAADRLRQEKNYHHATVKRNERITASDWYQDVRHLELVFDGDVQLSQ